MHTLGILSTLIILFVSTFSTFAQDAPAPADFMKMYTNGDFVSAKTVLNELTETKEGKKNATYWNYLGLCQYQLNEPKSAIRSFKKAVKLEPQNAVVRLNYVFVLRALGEDNALKEAEALQRLTPDSADANYIVGHVNLDRREYEKALKHSNRALEIDPKHAPAMMVKASSLFLKQMSAPVSSPSEAQLEETLEICRDYARIVPPADYNLTMAAVCYHANNYKERNAFKERDRVSEFKVLSKPRAPFTDAARSKGRAGKVILLAGFDKSGKVIHPLVLRSLGLGLDESSIRAALSIKFTPELVDGEAVSTSRKIEYMFTFHDR